jgi:type IV pilus assembly protein PilB
MITRTLDQLYIDRQLVDVLERKGIFKAENVTAWRQAGSSHANLESQILDRHLMAEEDWTRLKGDVWGIPYKNLSGLNLPAFVLEKITEASARNYLMVPFEAHGEELAVGLVEPYNPGALEALEFLSKENGLKIRYFIISKSSFESAMKQYHPLTQEVESVLTQNEDLSTFDETVEEVGDEVIKQAPIAQIVKVIIEHAIEGKASDIHIEPLLTQSRVRYRIDGVLHTSLLLPKYVHNAVVSRIKVLTKLKLDETRLPQDGRARVKFQGESIDLRVSILPLSEGEKVVIRVLDVSAGPPALSELGFSLAVDAAIQSSIKKPHGLILITGPTGSGKSTTLFGAITLINKEGTNIVTLEDPIEYFIEGINQSQINPDIGYSFAAGLRSILRQDPNVVMVGEVRDMETAELVIHASLTGHLVLSTLHTNDALGAVPRLIDMGVEPFLLSSALELVVAQRLVRKLCRDCTVPVDPTDAVLEQVRAELAGLPEEIVGAKSKQTPKKKVGCNKCGGTGYKGRLAIAEAIQIEGELQDLVAKGFERQAVEKFLSKKNFVNLRQDGLIKFLRGLTSLDEVIRVTTE